MLAFVHIPKTAGTTLHKILVHQYPKSRVFIHHDTNGPPDAALAETISKSGAELIVGHFSVGLHHHLPGLRYITCLRDPVSRIASHYRHAHHDPTHYLHQAARSMTLAGYAACGRSGELDNGMTRMLAGMSDFHHDPVDESVYQRALHHLETYFDAIVLTEQFDASILLAAERLHWPTPWYVKRKQGRGGKPSISPESHAAITAANEFDIRLHRWACERFQTTWENHPQAQARLARFQSHRPTLGAATFLCRELRRRFPSR